MTDTTGNLARPLAPVSSILDRLKRPKKQRPELTLKIAQLPAQELTKPHLYPDFVPGKNYVVRCGVKRGFCMVITKLDVRTWAVEFTEKATGKDVRRTIDNGAVPRANVPGMKISDAWREWEKLRGTATGSEPKAITRAAQKREKRRLLPTEKSLQQAHDEYIAMRSLNADSKRKYNTSIKLLIDVFGHGNMWDINKVECEQGYKDIVAGVNERNAKRAAQGIPIAGNSSDGKASGYNAMSHLTALWKFASKRLDKAPGCPVTVLHGDIGPAKGRTTTIEDNSLAHWWNSLDGFQIGNGLQGTTAVWALYWRMLVLTGCRRSELLKLNWSEVDLNAKTPQVKIPGSRTKNHHDHHFPIGPKLRAMLVAHRKSQEAGVEWVFAYPTGTYCAGLPLSIQAAGRARKAQRKAMGKSWTHHDLRRTATTKATNEGTQFLIQKKLVNHRVSDQTGEYAQITVEMMRPAQEKIERALLKLAKGKVAKDK